MSNSRISHIPTDELLREIYYREAIEPDFEDNSLSQTEFILDGFKVNITHQILVDLAADYMAKRAPVVLPEFYSWNSELPDVIAFNRDTSTVIECKVSRADFLRDAKKPFRLNPNSGMGDKRYYCAPKGLIKPEELPMYWGLIELLPNGKLRKVRDSYGNHKKNLEAEHHLLFYYARRAFYAGVHKTILDYRGFDK